MFLIIWTNTFCNLDKYICYLGKYVASALSIHPPSLPAYLLKINIAWIFIQAIFKNLENKHPNKEFILTNDKVIHFVLTKCAISLSSAEKTSLPAGKNIQHFVCTADYMHLLDKYCLQFGQTHFIIIANTWSLLSQQAGTYNTMCGLQIACILWVS